MRSCPDVGCLTAVRRGRVPASARIRRQVSRSQSISSSSLFAIVRMARALERLKIFAQDKIKQEEKESK